MLTKIFLANVAIVLLFSSVQADYSPEAYCPLVPLFTKLPNLDDCHKYFTCISPNMVSAESCPNNQVFNKDSQSCITTPNNSCGSLTNICENQNKKWVPDPKVCGNWYYCDNGKVVGSGHCKEGQNLDYDAQMCRNVPCSVLNNSGGVSNLCSIMQNGAFFGDFDDCKTWHKCIGLQMKSGKCQNTIYDSATRQCVQSNGNTCGGPTTACTKQGTTSPDSTVCSNYYTCNSNLEWTKLSCPVNYYYDVPSQLCKPRQLATPISTCDRCEYSTRPWVNAVDPSCTKYLFCKNGVKTGDETCKKGFFDEQQQRCSAGSDLDKYRQTNGACAAAPSPQPPGSETPGAETPGAENPENPGAENPGAENPENPGAENPGAENPENPGAEKPENPGSENPENPGAENPENPGAENPGSENTENPGAENPGAENPGSENTENPGAENPENPGAENPEGSDPNTKPETRSYVPQPN